MQHKTFKNAIPRFLRGSSSAVKPFINENYDLKENLLFPILLTRGFFLLGNQLVAQEHLSMETIGNWPPEQSWMPLLVNPFKGSASGDWK
jgi:hypothetical protein